MVQFTNEFLKMQESHNNRDSGVRISFQCCLLLDLNLKIFVMLDQGAGISNDIECKDK